MSSMELDSKALELMELRRMKEELESEIDAIQDLIKTEMIERGQETLSGTGWKCSWKVIESSRLDSKKLKSEMPEIAARFTVTTRTSRFTIN